ncbi:MAG: hypothetical protein B1H02_05880 [Candidatus Latescibacteria bacterium 4484_107]|nr:MAG: hypothetical protein B1H02_05880 [Candidatus Latescibacteria bacterium 4484_107]
MESAVQTLYKLKRYSIEEIESDREILWAVERGLQVAIQNLVDIGSHILSAEAVNDYEDYTEIIDRLGDRGVLPKDFAASIRGMAGFRNILVHEYLRIDLEEVYRMLHERLDDFSRFVGFVRIYLSGKVSEAPQTE